MTDPTTAQPATRSETGSGTTGPAAAPAVGASAAQILETIDQRPLHEHPEAYGSIHAALHSALTAIDDA